MSLNCYGKVCNDVRIPRHRKRLYLFLPTSQPHHPADPKPTELASNRFPKRPAKSWYQWTLCSQLLRLRRRRIRRRAQLSLRLSRKLQTNENPGLQSGKWIAKALFSAHPVCLGVLIPRPSSLGRVQVSVDRTGYGCGNDASRARSKAEPFAPSGAVRCEPFHSFGIEGLHFDGVAEVDEDVRGW